MPGPERQNTFKLAGGGKPRGSSSIPKESETVHVVKPEDLENEEIFLQLGPAIEEAFPHGIPAGGKGHVRFIDSESEEEVYVPLDLARRIEVSYANYAGTDEPVVASREDMKDPVSFLATAMDLNEVFPEGVPDQEEDLRFFNADSGDASRIPVGLAKEIERRHRDLGKAKDSVDIKEATNWDTVYPPDLPTYDKSREFVREKDDGIIVPPPNKEMYRESPKPAPKKTPPKKEKKDPFSIYSWLMGGKNG